MRKTLLLLVLVGLQACGDPAGKDAPPAGPASEDTLHRTGLQVVRDDQGMPVMEGHLLEGRRHGVWTSYNSKGGVKSRTSYANGELKGPTVTFREDGRMLYIGQHENGVRVGEWKFYDERGELVREVVFDSTGKEVPAR